MQHLVRLASLTVAIAAMLAIALGPIDRAAATSCVAYDATDMLMSEEPGLTLFIGTVTASEDPVEFSVDAVMTGRLGELAEVRVVDDFSPNFRQRLPVGSTWLVAAFTDADGVLTAGTCLLPQPIQSRDAAEQVIALAPDAQMRSTFEHLAPASRLRLGVVPSPAVVSDAPLPSAGSIPVAPTSGPTFVLGGALAALIAVGAIMSLVLWLVVRRARLALMTAAVAGLVVLALAIVARNAPAEPAPSDVAGGQPNSSHRIRAARPSTGGSRT